MAMVKKTKAEMGLMLLYLGSQNSGFINSFIAFSDHFKNSFLHLTSIQVTYPYIMNNDFNQYN